MKTLNVSEVRKHLPEIIDNVLESNEGVIITRHGRPVASIRPLRAHEVSKEQYPLRGKPITLTNDFDEPLTELWSELAIDQDQYDSRSLTPPRSRSRTAKGR